MYRKFYSYNDMPVLKKDSIQKSSNQQVKHSSTQKSTGLSANLENDDIILLIVIAILIMNNCDDKLLLLALAFIFFSDYFT